MRCFMLKSWFFTFTCVIIVTRDVVDGDYSFLNISTNFETERKTQSFAHIINGKQVQPNTYPWFARAMYQNSWGDCGGSLIYSNWVLTAAHCNEENKWGKIRLDQYQIGALCPNDPNNCGQVMETVDVDQVINHPMYNVWTNDYDISLVKLSKHVRNINPVKLDRGEIVSNYTGGYKGLYAIGFGNQDSDYYSDGIYPNKLHHVELKYMSYDNCKKIEKGLTKNMMCAWNLNKDSCDGDSGGPLYDSNTKTLVGVVSWGYDCADPVYPGFYTKISSQWEWIQHTICSYYNDITNLKPYICSKDSTLKLINNPFRLISSRQTSNSTNYCLYPKKYVIQPGTRIVVSSCKAWKAYKWTMDEEGKIISFIDQSLCIEFSGKKVTLQTCLNGLARQRWIYSHSFYGGYNIRSMKNGQKGLVMNSGKLKDDSFVYLEKYTDSRENSIITDAESWEIHYDQFEILPITMTYNIFYIVSSIHTTTNHNKCLVPSRHFLADSTKMAISTCKDWKVYHWSFDYEGKIQSLKNNAKCIERLNKRIQIGSCQDGNIRQKWVYNVVDQALVPLQNVKLLVTVMKDEELMPSTVQNVRLYSQDKEKSAYQTWMMVETKPSFQ